MERIRQDLRIIDPNVLDVLQIGSDPVVLSYNGLYINQAEELKRDTAINWYIKTNNAKITFKGNTCQVSYIDDPEVSTYFVEVFCVSGLDGRTFKRGVVFVKTPPQTQTEITSTEED